VNAELSPLELKALLHKANAANSAYQKYIAALEAEAAIWRAGGTVEQSQWAALGKEGPAAGAAAKKPAAPAPAASGAASTPRSPTPSSSRAMTPAIPAIEGLKNELALDSRPQTPTVIGLDKDEREDFLKRENELSDQLAEKESALTAANKLVGELKEELGFLKEQEQSLSKVRVHAPQAGGCSLLLIPWIRRTKRCPARSMNSASKSSD
jgi:kinesin family member 5